MGSNSSSTSSSSLVLINSSSLKLGRGVEGVVERERGGTTGAGSDPTSSSSSPELSSSLKPRIVLHVRLVDVPSTVFNREYFLAAGQGAQEIKMLDTMRAGRP